MMYNILTIRNGTAFGGRPMSDQKQNLLRTVFENSRDWGCAKLQAFIQNPEWNDIRTLAAESGDALVGNALLEDQGLSEKKTSFSEMLPYTALATFGFALADGGATSIWGPALFFFLAQPAMGMTRAVNEVRKAKGITLPEPAAFVCARAQGFLSAAFKAAGRRFEPVFDRLSGNDRLSARGIEKLPLSDISPYARAVTTGFALATAASVGVIWAVPLSLAFFGLSSVAMAQSYTSLQAFRHDRKNPPANGGQTASP